MEEGNGRTKLRSVIAALGYNRDVTVDFATVTAPWPDVLIRIDNVPLDFDRGDFVVCERLAEHERPLSAGDRVLVATFSGGQQLVVIDRFV